MSDPTIAGVHVVIVHHDRPVACARTVGAFCAQDGVASLTVVDSSSDPDSRAALIALLPRTPIIDAGGNVGFGPGANSGIAAWLDGSAGEWVAVAPHDAVPAPGCIRRMLDELADRPGAGLACAELEGDPALVPVVDKVMGGYYRAGCRGRGWQDVDYPHGTLLLARRATLEEIGLFDERYFAYCEEVDLALRARAVGWRVGIIWGAVVANGRPPAQLLADYLQIRNTLLVVQQHFGPKEVRARILLAAYTLARKAWRHPSWAAVHARLEGRAVADFRAGRFGPPPPAVVALSRRRGAAASSAA